MSNEIVLRETDDWSAMLPDVVRLADHVSKTAFVPKGLRGDPAAVAAAILSGREIGLPPMTAMAHIDVIDGMPTLDPEMMRALVLREGHELKFQEMTASRCVISGRRKGEKEWTQVAFTIDEARAMGLAAKDNWRKQPQNMLVARATGRICRLIFPDVIGGLSYIPEEIASGLIESEPEPEKPKRTAQRAPRSKEAASTPEVIDAEVIETAPAAFRSDLPPLPGETAAVVSEGPDAVTEAQVKKISVQLHELGISDRAERLSLASKVAQRQISSTKDLTKKEASSLIEHLAQLQEGVADDEDETFDRDAQ